MAEGEPLGIVPVRSAAALAAPAGRPLLLEALDVLAGSGLLGRIVVTAPQDLVGAVRALGVVTRAGGLRTVLEDDPGDGPVVLLDPVQVHTPPQLVPAVLEALRGAVTAAGSGPYAEPVQSPGDGPPDAVVPVRPVTDTLKRVAPDGTLTVTEDRDRFRWVLTPQAYRRAALQAVLPALDGLGEGPDALPRLLAGHGARVATLAAAIDVLRADDADGLELATAVFGG